MDVFAAFRRAAIACASFVMLTAAVQARADAFNAAPLQGREVGPKIANQASPAPAGGWQVSDDRMLNASINGQGGWQTITFPTRYDEEIATGISHNGGHSWRLSNWFHTGLVNPILSPQFASVGESGATNSDSGPLGGSAKSNHVVYEFWFRSASASPEPGSAVSTTISDGPGNRMTYFGMFDDAAAAGNGCPSDGACFHVDAVEVTSGNDAAGDGDATFIDHYSPALTRGVWYRAHIDATFVDGPGADVSSDTSLCPAGSPAGTCHAGNDQIHYQIFDATGATVFDVTIGSWEAAYYDGRYGNPVGTVVASDYAAFRVSGNPDGGGQSPFDTNSVTNRPHGVYLDDMKATPDTGTGFSTSFEFDRWVNATGGVDTGDCSVQANPCLTIAYAIAQSNPYDRINIAKGTYDLTNNPPLSIVKEGLILQGYGAAQPKIERTTGGANQALLVINGAKNVQVQNLEFDMDQSFIAEGIIANGFVDGLSISGNHFVQSRSNSNQNSDWHKRNAISINDDNGNSQNIGLGTGSNVSVTNNVIDGLANPPDVFLRMGVDMDNGVGTISGNTITTGVHDIRVRFSTVTGASSGTATLIDGNTLNGRGLEIDDPNAGIGSFTISNNHINALAGIDGIANNYPADFSIMRLMGNPQGVAVAVSGNTFAGYQGSYRGVLVENFPNTTFTGNTFSPANGVSDFVSLVVSNKALNTDNPPDAPLPMTITANGNTFNGSVVAGAGRAVEFLNDNASGATFGALNFGTTTANSFDGNLRWYFHLDDYNCDTANTPCLSPPLPNYAGAIGNGTFPYGPNTQVRPFTGNVSAANNTFSGILPSAMSPALQNLLQAQTYDKEANPVLGQVDYGLTETQSLVYVNASYTGQVYGSALAFPFANPNGACAATTVYFGVNAFATVSDGLAHVTNAGTVCIAKGNYVEAVNVTSNVQLIGDGNTPGGTVIAGAVTLNASGTSGAPLLLQDFMVQNAAGVGISLNGSQSYITLDSINSSGNIGDGFHAFGPGTTSNLSVTNSHFDNNGRFPPTFNGDLVAGFNFGENASGSNVTIGGSTFDGNNGGGLVVNNIGSASSLTTIQNWTITGSDFSDNIPLDPTSTTDPNGFYSGGGGIWLKTGAAGSVIDGFSVSGSTFGGNSSENSLNKVGITVRARPGTTMHNVSICNNTFSKTSAPGTGTQLTGINVFDDAGSPGYQPIVICGTTTFNNLVEGISGLEQFTLRGTKPLISLTGTLTLNNSDGFNDVRFSPPASAAYVNHSYTGDPNGTVVSFSHPQLNGGNPVSATIGVNAFATISDALAVVQSGGTVYVDAGTYAESSGAGQNLVVGIPVTILGQQATVDARNRDVGGGGDASETIIVPGVEDGSLTLGSLGNSAAVTVNSSNVTIDGVVIDGDNSALTSGINLNGSDPDADSGMFVSGSGGTLKNIVFRNFGGSGIFACEDLSNCASSTAGGDNVISQNRFTNITNPSTWGIGVYAGDDFYAQINDNLFDQVRVGIQFAENDHLADTGAQPPQVQGNEIHSTRIGLFFNLIYQNATTWTVSGNHIFASANAGQTGEWRGIQIESMQDTQTATITGNIIDASALLGQRSTVGYALNNWTSSNSATTAIDGGSVSNADVGVLATDAMNYTGPVDGALIQNIAFNNIALGAIYVEDTNEQTGSAAVTIGAGNTYTSVAHQLVLAGAAPTVGYANGGSVDEVFVRAAGTFLYGTPSTGPCTSAACTTANASINAGIADVAVGGTVDVEAGTFDENVVANKSVILHGPFAGTTGYDGSRDGTGEAMISPATGVALTLAASNAVVDGFSISIASGVAVQPGGATRDNMQFINNRVVNIPNGVGIRFEPGEGTPASGLTISGNLFADIGGTGTNGTAIELYKGTRNATVSDNHFDSIQQIALQANGGNGTVQGLSATGNVVRDPDAVGASNAFVITKVSNAVMQGNDLQGVKTGLFISDAESSLAFTCNSISGANRGISTLDFFGNTPNSGVRIFDNAILGSAAADVNNGMTQALVVGSNYYGGGNAVVTGSNAFVADGLSANPIGNAACGDNTPTQIVVRSGSGQFALITNSFASPLVGRVEDALGGAVMGESMAFTPPGSGASANLATASGLSDFNGIFSTTAIANSIAGPYAVMLGDTSTSGIAPISFMLTNQSATASIVLDSASLSATYDGNPHAVTATTTPTGLAYTVTYNGSATAPTNAGTYNVVATINDPSYSGSTSGTLTIAQKPETLTLSNLSQVYDGNPKSVTVTVSPDTTLAYSVTYNGSSTPPTAVGTYTVVAMVTDPNYTGSSTATLTITAASAPDVAVSISNGRSYVQYGKQLVYTIVVTNNGTADASSVTISAPLPLTQTLINATWTCVAFPGATCASHGSGDLNDTATIAKGAVLIYTLAATVNDDQSLTTDQVAMTATATVNGTPADSNPANNTATTPVTQIVIFRDGFEAGGDGAQNAAATTPLSSMSAKSTLSLDPAAAPQGQFVPQTWLRGVDANGRVVFEVDTLHIGTLSLMRLSVSDANGNLVPGTWSTAEQFAFGFAGSGGKYLAMLATSKGSLQMPLPAWVALPVQVYAAH